MKAIIEYKPEIHTELIKALDKEVEKANKIRRDGVKLIEKKVKLPGGKQVIIGKEMNSKVNSMLRYTFSYNLIKLGTIELEFKSLADNIPLIKQYTGKVMKKKIKKQLKKEFQNGIIKVK